MPTLLYGRKDPQAMNPGKSRISVLTLYSRNLALLGAFCLFLSAVEYMIPKPLPFLRIGLANLPLMLALDIFPLSAFLILVCIKILGQALITGTLFSYIFLFSLTGTFLSALVMFFLRRFFCSELLKRKSITFIGIGTAGAVVSNLSQLALAYVFIFRENTVYIAPVFLFTGLVTGIGLGIFCEVFIEKSVWYCNEKSAINNEQLKNCGEQLTVNNDKLAVSKKQSGGEREGKRLDFYENVFGAKALFIAGLFIMPALLFNPGTEYRVIQFIFFSCLVWLSGKKVNLLFSVFIITGIVAFNLIVPYGRVVFSIGGLKITSGALTAGIHRSVTLCALVMLSKVTIRQDLRMPGAFGELLCESLRIFSVLMNRKSHITAENFIGGIDRVMQDLSGKDTERQVIQVTGTKPAGYVILVAVIVISWLPWVI